MARRRWVNFQCRGVLLIWIIVGQGPTVLTVGAGGGCLDIFSLVYQFSLLSPSLWETARYRLKYCLKGPLRVLACVFLLGLGRVSRMSCFSFLSALSCLCFSFCVNGSDTSFCVLADASVDAAL